MYYSPWGHKELDWLRDWTHLYQGIWLNNFLSMSKKTCYPLQVFYLSVRLTVQFFFFFTIFQIRVNTKHLYWRTLTHSINTMVTLYEMCIGQKRNAKTRSDFSTIWWSFRLWNSNQHPSLRKQKNLLLIPGVAGWRARAPSLHLVDPYHPSRG